MDGITPQVMVIGSGKCPQKSPYFMFRKYLEFCPGTCLVAPRTVQQKTVDKGGFCSRNQKNTSDFGMATSGQCKPNSLLKFQRSTVFSFSQG